MPEHKKFLFDNFVVDALDTVRRQEETLSEEEGQEAKEEEKQEQEETPQEEPETIIEPEITYTQTQVDEMLKKAEQQGYEKGEMSAKSGVDAQIQNSLAEMSAKLSGISTDACGINEELEQQFVAMSKTIVRQLIPVLTEEHAAAIVNKFIEDNFNNFRQEKKLSFYLHPDIIQYVQDNVSKLANANDFEGKISLQKDEKLGISDCRVEWENGGVESNTKSLLDKVENLLDKK